jgi:NAD(P)-dependent dehydrogenase (short-subunit alcohol dehydrogenase family)
VTTERGWRLDGKVVIISGASRGIGKGLALGTAAEGAKVVCAARTVTPRPDGLAGTIHETVDAIRAAGGDAVAVRCDVGEPDDVTALVRTTVDTYGRVDVLVNNAMSPTRGLFRDTTAEMWDESMRINVRSLFTTCQAVLPHMTAQGAGSIINVSSGAAAHTVSAGMPPGYLVYSVAKAALERFTTALALEVAEIGVAVNALRPGAVKTEMSVHELGEDHDWSGWQEPAAVVPAVVFLAEQDGRGFTGRIVSSTEYGATWP